MNIQDALDYFNDKNSIDSEFLYALEERDVRKDLVNHFRRQPERTFALTLLNNLVTHRRENSAHGLHETLLLVCYLLGLARQIEDCLLIWNAKTTDFDTFCGLDIQLVVFAGVDETITYLEMQDCEEAKEALEYIHECNKAGDFLDLTSYFDTKTLPWFV
jgi:hypothetical protein